MERDLHKAAKWYWRAANLGDAQAMYNLGCCYAHGMGVEEDAGKASRWFAEAARRGYAPEVNDPIYGNVKSIKPPSESGAEPPSPGEEAERGGAVGVGDVSNGQVLGPGVARVRGEPAAAAADGRTSGTCGRMEEGRREPTEEEKRLFPGLVGLVEAPVAEAPATRGVPASILEKLEEAKEVRRRHGMHGEGEEASDDLSGTASDEVDNAEWEERLRKADGEGLAVEGEGDGLSSRGRRKRWFEKDNAEVLIGEGEEGMVGELPRS